MPTTTERDLFMLVMCISLPTFFFCFWLLSRHVKPSTIVGPVTYFWCRFFLSVACTGIALMTLVIMKHGWPTDARPETLLTVATGVYFCLLILFVGGSVDFALRTRKAQLERLTGVTK